MLNAFFQYAVSHDTACWREPRTTESDQGDFNLLFDTNSFDPSQRQTEETDSVRLGVGHDFTSRSQILASLVYQNADVATKFDPGFDFADDFGGYTAELQHIYRGAAGI